VTVSLICFQKGTKGVHFFSFIKTEFNNTIVGDSPKVESSADLCVEYNFSCTFESTETNNTPDDMAHKPAILSVLEVLPKEKKQKDEKTIMLGQAILDLLPLLQGQFCFTATVAIQPAPGSPLDTTSLDPSSRPFLEISVAASEALVSEAQLVDSNLFKVAVETLYSVPEAWSLTGPQFHYVVSMLVPSSAKKEQLVVFAGGLLKPGGEREPVPRLKKWPTTSGSHHISGCFIGEMEAEEEHGELNTPKDKDFRKEAEVTKKRVCWDIERRCFMESSAVGRMRSSIVECRYWAVEIMRIPIITMVEAGKGSKDKGHPTVQAEEEVSIAWHGMAFVDMAPLLYPGVKRIRGAHRIFPINEEYLYEKTKRQKSILKENYKQTTLIARGSDSSVPGTPGAKAGKGAKEDKKAVGNKAVVPETVAETTTTAPSKQEGQAYVEACTYIMIDITLDKPLVPKRPPEDLSKRVKELIPPRPPLPRHTASAEKAINDYQKEITRVADQVIKEYLELLGMSPFQGEMLLDQAAKEEQKMRLLEQLNYSGKYFTFKEQLKPSIVRIVREKLLQTSAFADQAQLQAFLSQLYIFLVDQMHISLNKILSVSVPETEAHSFIQCTQLKHFAKEAEVNEDFELASKYYQERIALDRKNPSHWFDYGAFCLLISNNSKAEECFQHALTIDQRHVESLLLCGIMAEMRGSFEDADTYFQNATCVQPNNVIAWTILGLFYESQENVILAEMAYLEANKHLRTKLMKESIAEGEAPPLRPVTGSQGIKILQAEKAPKSQGSVRSVDSSALDGERPDSVASLTEEYDKEFQKIPSKLVTTVFMETVQFLLEVNVLHFAQRALAQELVSPDGGPSSSYYVALARFQLQMRDFAKADNSLKEALHASYENPDVWALTGHLHYLNNKFRKARKSYERTLDFVTDACEMHTVCLRLGSIYLLEKQYEKAKYTYLMACKKSPSCLCWLGVGVACYRLGELEEAEDALSEANIMNNRNPEVWGYLTLICLQLNLQNEELLAEIHELQERMGFANPGFQ
ncbi:CFA70 protein, partial [Polypterus senegalus]|nr:CFA70 protein [Polypterus senegalus]